MGVIIEGDTALHEWAYEATEYRAAGAAIREWRRTVVKRTHSPFELEVYVEGRRVHKDVWLYETYSFDTLEEAVEFDHKLGFACDEERDKILDMAAYCEAYGCYDVTLNRRLLYEYSGGKKYLWERKR